jgi:hypothetical protein
MQAVVGRVVNFVFDALLAYDWFDPTDPPVDLTGFRLGIMSTDLFLPNIFEILLWIRDL